jgi:hypothetical protein
MDDSVNKRSRVPIVFVAAALCALLPVGASVASAGSSHAGSTTTCTPTAPHVSIDNTWAWASPGSWGTPGQQLKYGISVSNGSCGSASFVVDMTAPNGFAVSIPANTITLSSGSSGYVWAYVTSPVDAADGNYQLTASAASAGASTSATSWYKVYSSDTVAPKIYWSNPADGGAVSGRTTYVGFASSDDHAVKQVDVYLDGALVATKVCDNLSYDCQVSYKWSIRRVGGQHTATFQSTDWMGNVAAQTATFTVN